MKKLSVLTIGATILCTSAFFAAPVLAESLNASLLTVYKSNPTLLAKRAALRATDEDLPQALSDWYPEIFYTASAGYSRVRTNVATGTDRHQHREGVSQALTLTQNLYRGGQTVADTQLARHTINAERARLGVSEQSIVVEAVTAYMDYYRDKEILALNNSNEAVLTRQLDATTQRFEAGEITSTNVHQSRARLDQSVADRIKSERNLEISRSSFLTVIGYLPESVTMPSLPLGLPNSRDTAMENALKNNYGVIAADFDTQAATSDIRKQKGVLLPSVDLEWSASRKLQGSSETSRVDDYGVLLVLSVPIYQKGLEYSKLRSVRQTAAEQQRTATQARRNASKEALDAWETLRSAQARNNSFRGQIKATKMALEGVREEADVGTRSILDVLDAEQEFLNSKINLAQVQRDEIVASYELLAAIGSPLIERLGVSSDIYNPVGHTDEVEDKRFGGISSGDVTAEMLDEGKAYNLSTHPLPLPKK